MRKLTALWLALAFIPALGRADEVSAQRDERLVRIEQGFANPLVQHEDGIFVSGNLNDSIFSKAIDVQKVRRYLESECKKLGDDPASAFTEPLGGRWPEFAPKDKDPVKLAEYLVNRGIVSKANALSAAQAITYIGGGAFVGFSRKKINTALSNYTGIPPAELGDIDKAEPFLCVARQNGYDRNIKFSAGFFGTVGKKDLYFYYIPQAYFEAANESNFAYHGSDEYLQKSGNKAAEYYAKRSQEVTGYSFQSDTGLIRSAGLSLDAGSGRLHFTVANTTNKPLMFGLQSLSTVKLGEAEYSLVYTTINGRTLGSTSGGDCQQVNGGRDVVINPNQRCNVMVAPIEIPGARKPNLPNVPLHISIMGQSVTLAPMMRGAATK